MKSTSGSIETGGFFLEGVEAGCELSCLSDIGSPVGTSPLQGRQFSVSSRK
jgi:hypothetical protein